MNEHRERYELEEKPTPLLDIWYQWRWPAVFVALGVFAIFVTHSTIEGNWQTVSYTHLTLPTNGLV